MENKKKIFKIGNLTRFIKIETNPNYTGFYGSGSLGFPITVMDWTDDVDKAFRKWEEMPDYNYWNWLIKFE